MEYLQSEEAFAGLANLAQVIHRRTPLPMYPMHEMELHRSGATAIEIQQQAKAAFHNLLESINDDVARQIVFREGAPSLAWSAWENRYSPKTTSAGVDFY